MAHERPVAAWRNVQAERRAPWYKSPWPYAAAYSALVASLYYLTKHNPAMEFTFASVLVLYLLTMHMAVVIAAFREDMATGFLALFIPLYSLYFVLTSEKKCLRVLYLLGLVLATIAEILMPG